MGERESMAERRDHQHHERFKAGVRAAITWLHQRAERMNDPVAQQVLNSAATNLGWDLAAHGIPDAHPLSFRERVMGLIRNKPSEEGRALGKVLAKWCDDAEPKARLKMPELPPRCNSCAFREGPHVQNGSPTTQMDAMKCVMENVEFHCHQPDRAGEVCSGWAMMMLADPGHKPVMAPWPFSDEIGTTPSPHSSVRPDHG